MKEYKIKVDIDESGKISAETFGIEGTECIDELSELLSELGEIEKIKKKPEYYKTVTIKNSQKIRKK